MRSTPPCDARKRSSAIGIPLEWSGAEPRLFLVGFFVVLLVLAPVVVGFFATRAPQALVLPVEKRRFVAPEADDRALEATGAAYRGGVPLREERWIAQEYLELATLPERVRVAASLCRLAFCLAMLAIGPVLVFLSLDVAPALTVGVSGLALAAGQLAARRGLLSGSARGASRAFGVGVWTIVHQIGIFALVVLSSCQAFDSTTALRMFAADNLGILSLVYAIGSLGLGTALLLASRALTQWRAIRDAV